MYLMEKRIVKKTIALDKAQRLNIQRLSSIINTKELEKLIEYL